MTFSGAKTSPDYNRFGNLSGEILLDDVDARNNRMAVLIRRIFPNPGFARSQYIGLHTDGELNGSISVSAPACYNVRCGEKPVNDIAGIMHAENGDLILFAPRGRIRIVARDIDLIAEGNGFDTGFVNVRSNAAIDVETTDMRVKAGNTIGMAAEQNINLNSTGQVKISAGSVFKVIEGPDVSPITSPSGSGSNTFLQTIKGVKKLIESIK